MKDWITKLIIGKDNSDEKESLKTLSKLDYLDDVWVKDASGKIYKCWVFDINKKHVFVVDSNNTNLEFRFNITRPFTQTQLTQQNKTLFLNESCILET